MKVFLTGYDKVLPRMVAAISNSNLMYLIMIILSYDFHLHDSFSFLQQNIKIKDIKSENRGAVRRFHIIIGK